MVSVGVIPARGGSKGIYKKNIRFLCGKPLIAWTIETALQSDLDMVVVSTEDDEIATIAQHYGAKIHTRPAHLAADEIHSVHVVVNYLDFLAEKGIIVDEVMMIPPTSPLRSVEDINGALGTFRLYNCDSVISVCECDKPISSFRYVSGDTMEPVVSVDNFEVNRQDIPRKILEVNGSIYVSSPENLMDRKSFHEGRPRYYIQSKINATDVNNYDDFRIAEALLKG